MAWLMRDGEVLATVEIAETRNARRRGLLGRDAVDGAMVIRPCRTVHTVGMRFAVDVAFCDGAGTVLRTYSLRPWRVTRFVRRAVYAVEAGSGAFDRWRVRTGDRLEVRDTPPPGGSG
jgi:uncharacterized membrane protein (UPF0127 family)